MKTIALIILFLAFLASLFFALSGVSVWLSIGAMVLSGGGMVALAAGMAG